MVHVQRDDLLLVALEGVAGEQRTQDELQLMYTALLAAELLLSVTIVFVVIIISLGAAPRAVPYLGRLTEVGLERCVARGADHGEGRRWRCLFQPHTESLQFALPSLSAAPELLQSPGRYSRAGDIVEVWHTLLERHLQPRLDFLLPKGSATSW